MTLFSFQGVYGGGQSIDGDIGPVIESWAAEFHFRPGELQKLQERLAGFKEQQKMLTALNGAIDLDDAVAFSAALVCVMVDVIGQERLKKLAFFLDKD